jgi:hypothetical protein
MHGRKLIAGMAAMPTCDPTEITSQYQYVAQDALLPPGVSPPARSLLYTSDVVLCCE